MRRLALILFAAGLAAGPARAEGEKLILNESSVWRAHVTWMPKMLQTEQGAKSGRIYRNLTEASDPPPPAWIQPEFDDSSWGFWREIHQAATLKIVRNPKGATWKTGGEDTGVRLYEPAQYGQQGGPSCIGLRCFRGRFAVEDPAKVEKLNLAMEFRGGVVVYLNGREIVRAYLPKDGAVEPATVAESYPAELFFDMRTVQKEAKDKFECIADVPMDAGVLKLYNDRIRRVDVEIPAQNLRKGVNVLAIGIHQAPFNPLGNEKPAGADWSKCGLVSVELKGRGAVQSAVGKPKGLHFWTLNTVAGISPFGSVSMERVEQGAGVCYQRFPLTWGDPNAPIAPIRMVSARNAVCTGQVGASCDQAIRVLKAEVSELRQKDGAGRIAGAALRVLYLLTPEQPVSGTGSPAVSFLDALYEKPPAEVPPRSGGETKLWIDQQRGSSGVTTAIDSGAVMAVWLKVKVPPDAPAGEYAGTLTIAAEGCGRVAVPVELRVADWTAPSPADWISHVGTPHSPETLSAWYKTPLWSEEHWKLVEKTLACMGEIGSKAVYLPLKTDTWFETEQTLVYWVKQADGCFTYDYRQFDRYLDLVRKYLNPQVYCLYVADFAGKGSVGKYTLLDPKTGKLDSADEPEHKVAPETVAFWKPVIDGVVERLVKRGVARDRIMAGVAWEGAVGGGRGALKDSDPVALFKEVVPAGTKMVQVAHYGGAVPRGSEMPIPYGYVMSVWGNKTGVKSKVFGAGDLPLTLVQHYRSSAFFDLRPTAHRAALRTGVEGAMTHETQGIGPIGMDFWYLPPDAEKGRRDTRTLERAKASNLSMSAMSTCALLAPGPDGPVSTARFEMLREGLQECEARLVLERALADEASRARLPENLVKRCRGVIERREKVFVFAAAGGWAHYEGWRWFESSGWENRAYELFSCAGEVARALGK